MIRFPDGFHDPVGLPPSFGTEAYRGLLGKVPVILLALPTPAEGPDVSSDRARLWESLGPYSEGLARPYRWFLEGPSVLAAFHDPGGPLLSDLLDDPQGWEKFEPRIGPFLDQWERLVDRGATLVVTDPTRLVVTPRGLVSFDLGHVMALGGDPVPRDADGGGPEDLLVLSPEMSTRAGLRVDLRSGLFSWGTVLYRFLAHRWPGAKPDTMERLYELWNQMPGFDEAEWQSRGPILTAVVQKLLQKDPNARYQTLRGLKWDLAQAHRGDSGPFVPGKHDRSTAIAEVHAVYGRDSDLAYWTQALGWFQGGRSVVLVLRGDPGLGKSRLVQDYRRRTEPEGILWLQGKFDQFEPPFATGALGQIFDQWVRDPLGLANAVRTGWTDVLRAQVGRNLRVLTNLVPALQPHVGPGPELLSLSAEESQQRFLQTLVLFFGLVAAVRPLVVVVEDFHWADDLTMKVLEALAQARIPRFALIATCRPDTPARCETFLALMAQGDAPSRVLRDLDPLDKTAVEALLADASALGDEDRGALAHLLVRIGAGNPFTIGLLVREINRRGAAAFDEATGQWRLRPDVLHDLPRDPGLSLVVDRTASLGASVRRALLVAALLGLRFCQEEVITLGGLDPQGVEAVLEELLSLGIWERLGPGEFRFAHDRVQETVYQTATDEERHEAHLLVGRSRLARRRSGEPVPPGAVAVHLNRCVEALEPEERRDLIEVNVEAGEAARMASDYPGSLALFEAAQAQVGPDLELVGPDLGWRLSLGAVEAAYTEFRRDLADKWCEEAVTRAPSAVRRAQIRERQQSFLFYLGDIEGSIDAGMKGLKELGWTMSRHPTGAHVAFALAQVKLALVGRSLDRLRVQSENVQETSRILLLLLSGFIPPAFHSGQQKLFGVAVLSATLVTLRDGLSREAAPAYTGYAVLLAALGDQKGAYEFGRLAWEINQRYDDLTWRSMVLVLTGLFGAGWFEPWDSLRTRFTTARQASEDSGDLLYLTYAQLFATLWNPGEDLPQRLQRTEEARDLIGRTRFPLTRVSVGFVLQSLRLLQGTGGSGPGLQWASEGFDPEAGLEEYRKARSLSGLAVCYSTMASTAFLLGDLGGALEAMTQAEALRPAVAGSLYEEALTLYSGLIHADLVRRGSGARRGWLDQRARQARRWARMSPTFGFHAAILEAESLEIQGWILEAQTRYLAAIDAADSSRLLAYQALARERAARFFARHRSDGLARHYLAEARDHWRRYGARAKVALLDGEAAAAGVVTPDRETGERRRENLWDVDRQALVRALEAISGEIHRESLTRTITRLILENSGATRVVLLIPGDAGLVLEGETTMDGYHPGTHQPLVTLADLPQSLLRDAYLEGKLLVREELTSLDRRREPVLLTRGVKALLALPLVSPNGVQGLVYLENTVMPGILTRARVRILELLASTMAMALQNAHLFRQVQEANEVLERRVEERSRDLRASQKRILLHEKLASLGTLTAGIAHELKNPINIINNFAESSIELMEELKGELASVQDTLPPETQESVNYLIPELVQNMEDIQKHGHRGNNIIRSMLLHTRSDAGPPTEEDLNAVVEEALGLSFHGWKATHPDFECFIETKLDPRLPRVPMVRAHFGRVIINLCNNAFQAVGEKQRTAESYRPWVSVTTLGLNPGAHVVVEDNGPGIPPEIQDRLFHPFFTTKAPGEGTGLGLSMSREIIQDEFAGRIEVDSTVGQGARFTVVLPRVGEGV